MKKPSSRWRFQNRHRPFNRSRLSQRFLRMRDAEPIPEAMGSVSEVLLEYEDLPADLAWDPHQHGWDRRFALEEEYYAWADEYPYTHFNYWGAEEEDVLAEKVYQKFLALVSPSIMAEQISSVLPARKNSQRRKSSGKDIESRLFQFLTPNT